MKGIVVSSWNLPELFEKLLLSMIVQNKAELNEDDIAWATDRAAKHKLVRNH